MLAGRVSERAAIDRFLAEASEGPRGLLIEGEPGIGKTTLWRDALERARDRGDLVLTARPAEREQDLSFAALADLLRDALPNVGRVLPEPQRVGLEAALLLAPTDAPVDPRTTATGLVSVLAELASERPVLIAIDDVQWLDRAAERALEFALRRLPNRCNVLLARRANAPGPTLDLGDALGSEAVTRIRLGPLADDAIRDLVSAEGRGLSRNTIARIAQASFGNPFHALEITRALRDQHLTSDAPLPVPSSLEELIRARLQRLSDRAREAATVVSLLYRSSAAAVGAAMGDDADVEAAILEAEEADVLTWDGARLRFAHPLLGSALSGALSTSRRRALHQRLAEAVDDPEERAHHLVGSVVGANDAAAELIEAGANAAERRGAVDAAAQLYVAALERTSQAEVEARARRAVGAARASFTAGDLELARRFAEATLAIRADGHHRTKALLLQTSIASYAGTIDERIAAHEAALREAGADTDLRALVLSVGAQLTVNPWQALQHAEEAVRLLRTASDRHALVQALMNQVMASAVLGLGVPPGVLDEVRALEGGANRREIDLLVWFHWVDDVEGTRARWQRQVELAEGEGDEFGVAELAEFLAMVEFRVGSWEVAEELLEGGCRKLGELEIRGPFTASFADRSVVDAHRGRMDRARSTLHRIIDADMPQDAFWMAVCLSALGAVEFAAGDPAAADRAWTEMRRLALAVGWLEFPEDRSEPDHIEALLTLGEPDRARELLTHLEWRGRTIPRPWIEATLPRARALVAGAEGRLDEALALLEAGQDIPTLPFERARLLMTKGRLERRAGRKLAARRSYEEAMAIFERLGSPPWIDRAREEMGRLGLRHGNRHELTAMERRIAELAATGLTNRQVADAAFVSPKTVEANLARVYGKLRIRSRAELGARMGTPARTDPQT